LTGERSDGRHDDERDTAPSELFDDEFADVELFTGVRARELRFGAVPETEVRFEGEPAERSSSRSERENLPEEVEPGVTYRDVKVRWQARSRIVHPSDPIDSG
jgi:hypothetical protein